MLLITQKSHLINDGLHVRDIHGHDTSAVPPHSEGDPARKRGSKKSSGDLFVLMQPARNSKLQMEE